MKIRSGGKLTSERFFFPSFLNIIEFNLESDMRFWNQPEYQSAGVAIQKVGLYIRVKPDLRKCNPAFSTHIQFIFKVLFLCTDRKEINGYQQDEKNFLHVFISDGKSILTWCKVKKNNKALKFAFQSEDVNLNLINLSSE